MSETIDLCEYCKQAIDSRGEKLIVIDELYEDDFEEDECICDWCGEEVDKIFVCKFR